MARKKQQKPVPEAVEAQTKEFLENADREALFAILENVQALRDGMETLKLPSNDPKYLEHLQARDRDVSAIAERIIQIDIVPDGKKSYIGVGSFNTADAQSLARDISALFEAKIRQHSPE